MKCEVSIAYAAPAPKYKDELVEGDAGKELRKADNGAAGMFSVTLGSERLVRKVRNGDEVTDVAGVVKLSVGEYDIRIDVESVAGAELFRPRYLLLKPLQKA